MYGGLGDRYSFGLRETSHYLAPVAAWNLPSGCPICAIPKYKTPHPEPSSGS